MQAEYVDTDAQNRAIVAALNATGIPWKRSGERWGHWNIIPRSNLKPWGDAAERMLMEAIRDMPFGLHTDGKSVAAITRRYLNGSGAETLFPAGRGFRIYSRSV